MPAVQRTFSSGDQAIDGLLEPYRWAASSLTFSFPTAPSQYTGYRADEEPFQNFEALNATQQAAVRSILDSVSAVANISFAEVGRGAGDLRFGMSDAAEAAHAYTPDSRDWGGDSWYNNTNGWFDAPVKGDYSYMAFIHEIGHALGLKHPHEDYGFGAVPSDRDHMSYSVMSYRSFRGQPLDRGYVNEQYSFAQSLMIDDIAALQHLYGARFDVKPVDTVYRWSRATGEMFVNGMGQGEPGANRIFSTVWDGGGSDTYDFSAYAASVTIDLRPGEWSATEQRVYLGTRFAPGAVANALLFNGDQRSLIENAVGGAGADTIIGNQVSNHLTGGRGHDTLNGGAGADVLVGGWGGDHYYVDDPNDNVIEELRDSTGDDSVRSLVSYELPAGVETLYLAGRSRMDGNGNGLDNYMIGNTGANVLDGREGADFMNGLGGGDTFYVDNVGDVVMLGGPRGYIETVRSSIAYALKFQFDNLELLGSAHIAATGNGLSNRIVGNSGNNRLDGRTGADALEGRAGDDTYYVDHIDDLVTETADEGTDTVRSRVTHALGREVEHLILVGDEPLDGLGNGAGNRITGNGSVNRLDGGAGVDLLVGGGGDDVYVIDEDADRIVERAGGGVDLVLATCSYALRNETEQLTLVGEHAIRGSGNVGSNVIIGSSMANVLSGAAGDDRLFGGRGLDQLTGGDGADAFCFDTPLHWRLNVDEILDFARLEDDIHLDQSIFGTLSLGRLGAEAFQRGSVSAEADDRILFDRNTGSIYYDADGSGEIAAVLFARLQPGALVNNADFIVYG